MQIKFSHGVEVSFAIEFVFDVCSLVFDNPGRLHLLPLLVFLFL